MSNIFDNNTDELDQEQEEIVQPETPAEQEQEQQTDIAGKNLEEAITKLSEEELHKYDNFEQFVEAQANQQPQTEIVVQENQQDESNIDSNNQTVEQGNTESATPENTTTMSDEEFRQFITGEFRANNRNVQVSDPKDIRKLMQYGMNFHKKMAELAPHRKILKALEQHGLTDESKVNFAIELMQGNPAAIAQLLKQHEVDSYNLPDLEETPYTADNYIPSDAKVNFDEVIEEVKQLPQGNQVINLLQTVDSDSFHQVYTNPVMVQNLAKHAESGLMQDALSTLETEKALGKVPAGISDIDAYAFVAQHLEKTNPSKYGITQSAPKVVGNNIGKRTAQSNQTNTAKNRATIPNASGQQQQTTYSGIDVLLNASSEDLDKFPTFEDFLAKNNINF